MAEISQAKITDEVLKDSLALSVAGALTFANKKAEEYGIDLKQTLISIAQDTQEGKDMLWRVHYGPKDYIRRRGGEDTLQSIPHLHPAPDLDAMRPRT